MARTEQVVLCGAQKYGHKHAEAFMLMRYATKDGWEVEFLWNSRDGFAPLCVFARSGETMSHVEWAHDFYVPDYKPMAGERIFVDVTEAIAYRAAEEMFLREIEERNRTHRTRNCTTIDKRRRMEQLVKHYMKEVATVIISAKEWGRHHPTVLKSVTAPFGGKG